MKIIKIISCAAAICMLFSSCSQTYNLRNMNIVQGLGIDLKGSSFEVTLQILDTVKEGTGVDALSGNITSNLSQSAPTVSQAISKCSASSAKKVFTGQNKVVVFGSEVVSSDITRCFDYLIRSTQSRPDVLVAMSLTSADDVLSSKENDALVPAEAIYDLLKDGENSGIGAAVTVKDLINAQSSKTSDLFIPVLKAQEDKPCEIYGLGIFSKSKFKTILNNTQTLGFHLVRGDLKETFITVKDKDFGNIGVKITNVKSKTKVFSQGGDLHVESNIEIKAQINDLEKNTQKSLSVQKFRDIEHLINEKAQRLCENAFSVCVNENCSDVFSLGKMLAKSSMSDYKALTVNWDNSLKNAHFFVSVNSSVRRQNDNSVRD